ncbi:type III restriction/modification enzyme restriction subunit [Mucilaginibacter oryzae]|uniref:Type III restriction/modification enzyme restriction subunit n=1 Tax=Mucilaginibacter oryzae TaxID=468058 RepID=A0A316H0B5_9SPHI|nr:DEAD/DEAH box helicase family protein [Mucilaginibacter oryzae]PWK71399.1 type III restriction/modification enzyme restriction subunit [Mucilaginibacter oryzae]
MHLVTGFPDNINFQYGWRKYQQRVLDRLDEHLIDGHLHVIAPPGSGKTILGLEVARRINNATLILAPSIAIRNQWVQRFCDMFLQTAQVPGWLSTDIRNPAFLTISTYQGLHAVCNNLRLAEDEDYKDEEEESDESSAVSRNQNLESIIAALRQQNVKTIVIDEAHHLKNEWCYTLMKVKETLDPVTIGLTATPPYDVSPNEWQRYIELNGPVSVEISVPELVIEGDLCPHQDYVYLSRPTQTEKENIGAFRQRMEALFAELTEDKVLITAIESHPAWVDPAQHLDWIYTNLSCYSASLIFVNGCGREVSKQHLDIIDDKDVAIPAFDYKWAAILLDFYLYKEKQYFKGFEYHKRALETKLRRGGAIENKQISFLQSKQVTGALASSISKLQSIKHIVDFEYGQLGQAMRMVVLTDYIRKEFYVNAPVNHFELNKIGVMTIFEKLRRENPSGIRIGVLTGSVVIIPRRAYPAFEAAAKRKGIEKHLCSELPFDRDYMLIEECGALKNNIVHLVTAIFQEGEIELLIGTKSLLGEGWDAPAINTLVLASFVGSFVLSNQMRGRAIRTQKGNLNKTGNIWHLACVDDTSATGGDDFDTLKRRFKSFVGVSFKQDGHIENGIGRLNIPENIRDYRQIDLQNQQMLQHAANRSALKESWDTALAKGESLIEEIKIPFGGEQEYQEVKSMYFNRTIKNIVISLLIGMTDYLVNAVSSLGRSGRLLQSREGIYSYLTAFFIIGLLIFARRAFKAFRLYVKYRDIAKDVQHVGEALLDSLIKIGTVKTVREKLAVEAMVDKFGAVYCYIDGASAFEKSTFISMLYEIVGPVDNPRYVITRKSFFMRVFKQEDFHPVPELIGRNKHTAEYFADAWKRLVGPCDLIFTRSLEGRRLLLKARIKSLAAQFEKKAQRLNKWQ